MTIPPAALPVTPRAEGDYPGEFRIEERRIPGEVVDFIGRIGWLAFGRSNLTCRSSARGSPSLSRTHPETAPVRSIFNEASVCAGPGCTSTTVFSEAGSRMKPLRSAEIV
jgi:hypothetical protein